LKENSGTISFEVSDFYAVTKIIKEIPNISEINSNEELAALNHKLVRFDCIVSDMYEEEIFVSVLK
jgi:hypothetical protein